MSLLIITSTYNRPLGVVETVRSVIDAMGDAHYLHVVVNDGGADVSECLAKFESKNLIIENNQKNLGKNRTVNNTVKLYGSAHLYFLSLDDDDILLPNIRHINFSVADISTIVTPKQLINVEQHFDIESGDSYVYFENALAMVSAINHRELAFAVNIQMYEDQQDTLRFHMTKSGPELCIYDIISRCGVAKNIYLDVPVMKCAYQADGMTAGFNRRLKNTPHDFEKYYRYLVENSPSLRIKFTSLLRLLQLSIYARMRAFF